ncbi:ParB N-terminal domain-containing protein [Erythrobacter sp. sf7]|uniref:ParB N-terminal domain-containing protein n=1 Tax=Erythrobacter fulvus TaxID=2987523 RepID=A0ABT5JRI0_9SPHN|nr:ParB N-terminal domain-containing protein [Erythrobacter fulvus]MDC8755360.1 ParB N-terminal domain-containing protein [Erythrobacter fulvus]
MSISKNAVAATQRPGTPAVKMIKIDQIATPEGGREFSKRAIKAMLESMKSIGLLTPITIRFDQQDSQNKAARPILVAGVLRLQAAKELGWTEIACIVAVEEAIDVELRAIAENLNRKVLTKKDRDAHIRRYADLLHERDLQYGQNVPFESKRADGKGHKPLGLAARIAVETGLSKKTIDRALNADQRAPDATDTNNTKSDPEAAFKRLQSAWRKAEAAARQQFLNWAKEQVEHVEASTQEALRTPASEAQQLAQTEGV